MASGTEVEVTPVGILPKPSALTMDGLSIDSTTLHSLLSLDVAGYLADIPKIREHFAKFDRLPIALSNRLNELEQQLKALQK